jgi:hypothetical protein
MQHNDLFMKTAVILSIFNTTIVITLSSGPFFGIDYSYIGLSNLLGFNIVEQMIFGISLLVVLYMATSTMFLMLVIPLTKDHNIPLRKLVFLCYTPIINSYSAPFLAQSYWFGRQSSLIRIILYAIRMTAIIIHILLFVPSMISLWYPEIKDYYSLLGQIRLGLTWAFYLCIQLMIGYAFFLTHPYIAEEA